VAEIVDLRAISEIAQGYVAFSDQCLAENLGRPYNIQEIAQFSETAAATLLASAYANFREHLGKEAAEAWLKKTLSVAASTVRLMGADALLRFEVHIKDMPNKLHQRPAQAKPEAPPAAAPEAPVCKCILDEAGACAVCIPVLGNTFKGSVQFMRHMADAGKKMQTICRACQTSQTDRALATIVPDIALIEVPREHREGFHQEIIALFHQIAGSQGATAIPITEKAWKDAVKPS
jgi:hypothetical protein